MATNELEILVTAEVDKAIKNMKKVEGATKKTAKNSTSSLKKIQAGWVAVAAVLTGTVAKAFVTVVKRASEAQETLSKFDAVFKDVREEANKTADNLAKNFGLSSTAARQLLSDTGDLLSGFGFTGKAALDLSKEVNELAVDLASFTNAQGGAVAVSAALSKSLLGERESLKTYGIAILEADVKAKVLENTQKGLTFETERQARAYATLHLAQEQSKNAIGDFERTSKNFANQVRILRANFDDLVVFIGSKFLPILTRIANGLNNLVQPAKDTAQAIKDFSNSVGGIRAIATSVLILQVVISSLKSIIQTVFGLFRDNITQARDNIINFGKIVQAVFSGEFTKAFDLAKESIIDTSKVILKNGLAVGIAWKNLIENNRDNITEFYEEWNRAAEENAKTQQDESEATKNKIIADQEEVSEKTGAGTGGATKEQIEQRKAFEKDLAEFVQLTDQEKQIQLLENERRLQEELRVLKQNGLLTAEEVAIAEVDIATESARQRIALEEQVAQARLETARQGLQFASQVAGETTSIINDSIQNQIDAEEEGSARKKELQKKQFIANKAAAIVQAGINTALAITGALGGQFGGVIAKTTAAKIIGALGLAQIAIIAAKPIPAFQDGGVSEGGLALVGEQGAELVNLPRGANVTPAGDTNRILNDSRAFNVENITLPSVQNGEQFFSELQKIQRQYGALSFGG